MFKKIWRIIKALFGGRQKPITPGGPTVVSTWLDRKDGKVIKVTKYSDGTSKREPYNASDPSDVGGFLDDIGK